MAPSLHSLLRESTRADHLLLDAAMSCFDLREASSYRRFLAIHRVALTALSTCCSAADRAEFDPLLAGLDADLGMVSPPADTELDTSHKRGECNALASQVGVAYVVRGSRLGAAFLLKRVGADLPTTYLRHQVTTSWSAFLAGLNADPRWRDRVAQGEVIAAARSAFAVFGDAARAARPDIPNIEPLNALRDRSTR